MKKIKNLSILLIAVIMSSAGLVSCIDNEISPVVEEIYKNQALLIASQANLNDAKAAYQDALGRLEDARAAAVASAAADASQAADDASQAQDDRSQAAADASALAAQYLSEREAALEQVIALNAIALENALMALEEAKLTWEASMIALQAAIDEANIALASEYFTKYQAARNAAIILEGQAIMKQSQIEIAQLLINEDEDVSWEYYLTQQNGLLTSLQNELAAKQVAAADLAAVIADPSTIESMSSALQAEEDENDDAIVALEIELAEIEGALIPVFEELNNIGDLDSDYHDTKDDIEDLKGDIEGASAFTNWVETAVVPNLEWQIANYDANVAAAAATAAAATADVATATADVATATGDKAITAAALSAADQAVTDATNDLGALQTVIDGLEGTLNAAAVALAGEQAIYDAGIVAATALVASTGVDVTNANNAVSAATVVYETWRDRFEGGPTVNGGYFWEDTTSPSVVLGDDVLGTHTDASGAATTSYVRVASWTYNDNGPVGADPTDTYTPLTIDVAQQGTVTGPAEVAILGNGTLTPTEYLTAFPLAGSTETYFVEVGMDDVSYSNLAEFQAATTALGNEDIMDVPPVLGDMPMGGADAYTALWNAMLAEIDAIDALLHFGDDLAAAQETYDELKEVYENELILLVAAQGVLATAIADQIPFAVADNNAAIALGVANTALGVANTALGVANSAVAALAAYTPADMQEDIEEWEHDVVEANITLAIMEARLVDLEAQFAVIEAELDALGAGEAYQALIDLFNEMEVVNDEIDALEMRNEQIELVLDVMDLDNSDLQDILDDCNGEIADLEDAIAAQEAVIAIGEVDEAAAQSAITQLENQLSELEAQIASFDVLADKYWELMQAALAS